MSVTECRRRPASYWTTCDCPPCVTDRRRTRKRFDQDAAHRVPHETAERILRARLDDGWTALAVGSATGLRGDHFTSHATAHKRGEPMPRLGPVVAAALVNIGTPTEGSIGVVGTRRRLQGLAVLGHSLNETAATCGVGFSTLGMIRHGATTRVKARNANAVKNATDALGETIGGHWVVRRDALGKSWLPLMAWDDIDDPTENPYRISNVPDPVVIQRILAGDFTLAAHATRAERIAVVAGWTGTLAHLERGTRWNVNRYRNQAVA